MKLVSTIRSLATAAVFVSAFQTAFAADKVRFGTDWLAEADHGGFYQAVADGTYAKYGLDVEILQGGPSAQNRALLLNGKIDFYLGSGLINSKPEDDGCGDAYA